MATIDPGSLIDSILNLASSIQKLGSNYFQASDAWRDLPNKVDALYRKLNVWKQEVDDLGLSWDQTVVEHLRNAEELLKKEEAALQKRNAGRASGFRYKLTGTIFPDQTRTDRSITQIVAVFDNILQAFKDEREIRGAAYGRALAQKPTLGFQRDKRYIRLQFTEELVRKALTEADGPKVVLLHGGTGKGKSCLARDVALQVEPSEEEKSSQQFDSSASSNTPPNPLAQAFDQIVYVECGPEVQVSTIQLDLWRKLGRNHQTLGDQKAEVDFTAQSLLKGLLQSKKILIIFDDVWNHSILQSIIGLCGRNVRCLITSQKADVCRPLNCKHRSIPMEDINVIDAKRILASHILGHQDGFNDNTYNIPKHLEGLAEKIINNVDANPLAIACVATEIDPRSFQDERVWQKVVEDFSDSLNSVDTAMIHNSAYPYSFWVAMQKSVEKLTKEERKFFILVSSCRGPSVPEEVVEYFYKLLKVEGFSQSFLKAKKQLVDRQLIHVREGSCSIHSLLLEFVDRELQADKSSIISQLQELSKSDGKEKIVQSDWEVDILKVIVSLYLDNSEVTRETLFTKDTVMNTLSALDEKRYLLEPITLLLLSNIHGLSETTSRSHVREVFLTYMEAGSIHEEAASTLLGSSNSKCIAAMLDFLIQFAKAHATKNVSVGEGVVHALLNLMRKKDLYEKVYCLPQNRLLWDAADATYWVHKLTTDHSKTFDLSDTTLSTSFSSAVEQITTALTLGDSRPLQKQAIRALWDLSAINDAVVSQRIATPRLLGELGKILNEDNEAIDLEIVAIILRNLALNGGEQVCEAIVSIRTGLQGLVNALIRDEYPKLQAEAARTLEILSNKGGERIALKISRIPESLKRLVDALTKASNPKLQEYAAATLAMLALKGGQDLCAQISSVPTALQELVDALEMVINPDFQACAAGALRHLTSEGGESIAVKISCIPESLEKLVHALGKATNSELQEQAAGTLAWLAWEGGQDLCGQISSVPTALQELVDALQVDTNPGFQAEAARALRHLTSKGGETIAVEISHIPESLERLVHALPKATNPELQEQATWVLAWFAFYGLSDLGEENSSNQVSVPQMKGALERSGHVDARSNPTSAISCSTTCTTKLHLKLAETKGLIESLVVLANDNINSHKLHPSAAAIRALTLIDPARGRQIDLNSARSYYERGCAELLLGLYRESLEDLNEAWRIQPLHWEGTFETLRDLRTVKVKLGDFKGALIDANSIIERDPTPFAFQERGVLRRMMGDLPGALMDLDVVLQLEPDDYEGLKHRGYVKFLSGDENGARADAESAFEVKPSRVDFTSYGRDCLGASTVEYMGFRLR